MAMESIRVPSVSEKKCISDEFFPKTKGWQLDDVSVGNFGRLALSGSIKNTNNTFTALFDATKEKASDHDDIFWKVHQTRQNIQFIAINQEYQRVVTASSDHLTCYSSDRNVLKGDCKLKLKAACISSQGEHVFVSFQNSNIVSMFDLSLEKIRDIHLEEISESEYPSDLKVSSQMCLICTSYSAKPLSFDTETGKFITEYVNPFGSSAKANSISSTESSGVVVVLWDSIHILLYSETNSTCNYIIKVTPCNKMRISEEGKMVTLNSDKALLHVYQMDLYVDYTNFISKLSALLTKADCETLANHFKMEKGVLSDITRSEQPAISLLRSLENGGLIKPGSTLPVLRALHVAGMDTQLSEMYTFHLHTQEVFKAEQAGLERKFQDQRTNLIEIEMKLENQTRTMNYQREFLATAHGKIKKLKAEVTALHKHKKLMDELISKEKTNSQTAEESMKEEHATSNKVKEGESKVEEQNKKLSNDFSREKETSKDLQESLTRQSEEYVKVRTEQQTTFTQALNEQEPIVTDLNSMRDDLEAKTNETMEYFTREKNSVEQEQLQLQQRLNQLEQLSSTTEEELKLAKSAVVDLQSKKDNLEKQQQQLEEKMEIVEKNERQAKELLQETSLMIKDMTNKKKMLLEKKRQREEKIQYHREELDEKDSKIRELEDKVAQLETENRQLNTDLDAARAKSDHQQQLLRQAMNEKAESKEELSKCKNEKKQLSEELSSEKENITRLNSRLNETKKEMENLTAQNEQFRKIKQTLQESGAREKDRSEKLQISLQQASALTDELKKNIIMLQYDRDHYVTAVKSERNKTRKLHEFISEALQALGMLNHLIDFFRTEETKMENISVEQMETEFFSGDVTERNEMLRTHVADIISRKEKINELGEALKSKNQLRIDKKKETVNIREKEKNIYEKDFAGHQEIIETNTRAVKKVKEGLENFKVKCEHKLELLEKQRQDNTCRKKEEEEKFRKQTDSMDTNKKEMEERVQEKKYLKKWKTKLSDAEYMSVNNMTPQVTAVVISSIDRDVKQIDDNITLLTKTGSHLTTLLTETLSRKEKIEDAIEKINSKTEDVTKLLKKESEKVASKESHLKKLNTLTRDKEKSITDAENEIQRQRDKLSDKMKQDTDLASILNNAKTITYVMLKKNTLLEESMTRLFENIRIATEKINEAKELLPTDMNDEDLMGVWRHPDELRASSVVSEEGGRLRIHGTDISLDIPEGAVEKQCVVTMKVISQCLDPENGPVSFSTNSTLVVELLPNNLELKNDVKLRIPHCLTLKQGFNINESAEALISHHEEGNQPKWELFPDVKCELHDTVCTLYLRKFCWVTYKVKDEIIRGKRLKIFTAGRQRLLTDREADIEVGYFPDMPGKGEILRLNKHLKIGQCKPFLFRKKEDEAPLQIKLLQITPRVWKNNTIFGDTQEISYESISSDTEKSCPFNLRYEIDDVPREIPFCIFDVAQQDERIKITIRPEVYDDDNEDTDIDDTDVED